MAMMKMSESMQAFEKKEMHQYIQNVLASRPVADPNLWIELESMIKDLHEQQDKVYQEPFSVDLTEEILNYGNEVIQAKGLDIRLDPDDPIIDQDTEITVAVSVLDPIATKLVRQFMTCWERLIQKNGHYTINITAGTQVSTVMAICMLAAQAMDPLYQENITLEMV